MMGITTGILAILTNLTIDTTLIQMIGVGIRLLEDFHHMLKKILIKLEKTQITGLNMFITSDT